MYLYLETKDKVKIRLMTYEKHSVYILQKDKQLGK